MKKIPTLFERDWNGDKSRVLPVVSAGCEWVAAGEGAATRKVDGTCCMIRGGRLYKRQEFRQGAFIPDDFEEVGFDTVTGKRVGWRPVGDGPDDKWHRDGFSNLEDRADGTYELVGPKIQGNPEGYVSHALIRHSVDALGFNQEVPRDFDGLRAFLSANDIEGIVFHHGDGRMAKIKGRDFGLKR